MTGSDERAALTSALAAAGERGEIERLVELSGGCVHRVVEVRLVGGRRLVAKINRAEAISLFEEEAAGLREIASTRTVCVPDVLAVCSHEGYAVLLQTLIEPPARRASSHDMWKTFGKQLAMLHQAELPKHLNNGYGFDTDNHIGSTPQLNAWMNDWVEFNSQQRLGYQLKLTERDDSLNPDEHSLVQHVIDELPRMLPAQPRPSLIHGDLWSGNVLPCAGDGRSNTTCALIDPAPSVGDALADIAMMQLFGGIPDACTEAWASAMAIDLRERSTMRAIFIYQLYHVLNHVNLFGRGYASQAASLARQALGLSN